MMAVVNVKIVMMMIKNWIFVVLDLLELGAIFFAVGVACALLLI